MRRSLLAFTAVLPLSVAGCDADRPAAADPPPDVDIVVSADDMVFAPDRIEVPAGKPVDLYLENLGGVVHDLVLEDGWESGEVRPGQATTVTLGPLTASTVGWCSVPGHRDAGMELLIDVVDGS